MLVCYNTIGYVKYLSLDYGIVFGGGVICKAIDILNEDISVL